MRIQTRVAFHVYSTAVKNRLPSIRDCGDAADKQNDSTHTAEREVFVLPNCRASAYAEACRFAPGGVLQPGCPCLRVKCTSSNRIPRRTAWSSRTSQVNGTLGVTCALAWPYNTAIACDGHLKAVADLNFVSCTGGWWGWGSHLCDYHLLFVS